MTDYLAKRGKLYSYLSNSAQMDECLALGYAIVRRDEHGETLMAADGKWLEAKPTVETVCEADFSEALDERWQQLTADLNYISMMTGVDL